MPKEFSRTLRVGEQLRRELALLVHDEVKDPRAKGVTILDVEVSKDLAHARVYFTVPDFEESRVAECGQGLNRAAGFLRRELGRRVRMRVIPELRFIYDATEARAQHIESLIAQGLSGRGSSSEEDD